jgi:NAD(P)-dependent dehydrogenase (short-subunit alcohol dehydrogenase family)
MRNLAKADLLRSRAADEGLDVEVVALDVTDDDSVASAVSAVSAIHDRFGLASEVNPFGVRVECIEPGYFATAIQANSDSADDGISGTDYEADGAWFDAFDRSSVDGGADPSVVADAIVAAVDDLDGEDLRGVDGDGHADRRADRRSAPGATARAVANRALHYPGIGGAPGTRATP